MVRPHQKIALGLGLAWLAAPAVSWAQTGATPDLVAIDRPAFEIMRDFFEYDRAMPLDARVTERVEAPNYVREKIVFSGPRDRRVPGFLAMPADGNAPHPCVLLLHGIGSSKEDWWKDDSFPTGGALTERLLASGFAVLTLDAEYHGERLGHNDYESPTVFTLEKGWVQRARDMVVQSTVEYRRALDYLDTRAEVDASRVGVVGYSMGGMMTFALAATDPRVAACVASVTPILKEPHSALAVHNFAPFVEGPAFLMLMGDADRRNYTPDDARALHALIASPAREIVFYASGHRLPPEWTDAAAEWIGTHLR